MLRICFLFIISGCCFFNNSVHAEHSDHDAGTHTDEHDEDPVSVVPYFTERSLFDPAIFEQRMLDTTHANFHHYDFYKQDNLFYATKGNVGHPVRNLRFEPLLKPGFIYGGPSVYPRHLLSLDSVRYYRPKHVLSELFYVMGSENEQLFYAKHNQRFSENICGGIKYQTVNSPGMYSRLGTRNASFIAYAEGEPVERYRVAASFVINRIFNKESGGLRDHVSFEEDEVRDSVFLYNAESRIRDLGFRIHQSYHPGFYRGADTLEERPFTGFGQFRHTFAYKRHSMVFHETTSPSPFFYEHQEPFDPQLTYDSTVVHTTMNQLTWTNATFPTSKGSLPLHVKLFIRHQLSDIRQPALTAADEETGERPLLRNRYSHLEPGARIVSDPERFFSFDAYAQYIAGGYNDQDYGLGGGVNIGRGDHQMRLRLHTAYAEQEAPYLYNHYRSNYVSWENTFRKSRTFKLGARFTHPLFALETNHYLLNRAVFLNPEAYPEQIDGSFSVINAAISAKLSAGFLRSQHKVLYQYTGNNQYERFPEWISHHSLYADFDLFDKALYVHIGVDLRHHAPYQPMAYMPVHQMFYIQNDYTSDHELLLDAFLNARISRARLFVMFRNLLGLVNDQTPVYDIPFYPLPETMFNFGVSWLFFD